MSNYLKDLECWHEETCKSCHKIEENFNLSEGFMLIIQERDKLKKESGTFKLKNGVEIYDISYWRYLIC